MELKDLTTNPPEDIKLIPCEDDITDIQANITGPAGTPYEGGVFRVKLKLGTEFPAAPPKVCSFALLDRIELKCHSFNRVFILTTKGFLLDEDLPS